MVIDTREVHNGARLDISNLVGLTRIDLSRHEGRKVTGTDKPLGGGRREEEKAEKGEMEFIHVYIGHGVGCGKICTSFLSHGGRSLSLSRACTNGVFSEISASAAALLFFSFDGIFWVRLI